MRKKPRDCSDVPRRYETTYKRPCHLPNERTMRLTSSGRGPVSMRRGGTRPGTRVAPHLHARWSTPCYATPGSESISQVGDRYNEKQNDFRFCSEPKQTASVKGSWPAQPTMFGVRW